MFVLRFLMYLLLVSAMCLLLFVAAMIVGILIAKTAQRIGARASA